MATEYDARRPRLPKELAQTIDRLRGQMPFNAFVVRALEMSLEDVNAGDDPLSAPEPKPARRSSSPSLDRFRS